MANLSDIKGGKVEKKKKDKTVRFKLTKEQQAYVNELTSLESRIKGCQDFIQLWLQFFRFFAGDLAKQEITSEQERAFLAHMTKIARRQFEFDEMMGETFGKAKDIMGVLADAVSLENIKSFDENKRDKFEGEWHGLLLQMNKGLGRLVRSLPGDLPLADALAFLQWDAKQEKNPEKPIPLEKRVKAFAETLESKKPKSAPPEPEKKAGKEKTAAK